MPSFAISFASLITTVPFLLLLLHGSSVRRCSAKAGGEDESSRPDEHGPLSCNTNAPIDVDSDECLSRAAPFSVLLSSSSSSSGVTVPCGECVVVDVDDGSTVDAPALHVLGRLHVPSTANLVLRTTAVIVQGTWSAERPAEGNVFRLVLRNGADNTSSSTTTTTTIVRPFEKCGCADVRDAVGSCDPDCEHQLDVGKKAFAVVGGRVDIRAADEDCPSWTKLKAVHDDVNADASVLVLDAVFVRCLRPGDDLLVTSDKTSFERASAYTVASIDGVDRVTLNQTLPRPLPPSEAGPGEPEFAVEVASLRRDVVFEAESDPDDDLSGGHSIVHTTPRVPQRIEGVRFENFGRAGQLGRYPIHFHVCGTSPSFVTKNVVIRSNQRCVFLHSTNNVTVHDNVAYDTAGHCFSTEMGDEVHNVFSRNLGATTRLLSRSQGQSDSAEGFHQHQAATFWIRNMRNTVVGNVAAGSQSLGFWLELPDITSSQLDPANSFKDNVAHSNYVGLTSYKKGWRPTRTGIISHFYSYKNNVGFKFHITGNVRLVDCVVADNYDGVRYGAWNAGLSIENTVFLGMSDDVRLREKKACPYALVGLSASCNNKPDKLGVTLTNVTFSRFTCGVARTVGFYQEGRNDPRVGAPLDATDVTIVDSDPRARPTFPCDESFPRDAFVEDERGTLGPPDDEKDGDGVGDGSGGRGVLVRSDAPFAAFLPDGACRTNLSYDRRGCTGYCRGVCLRRVRFAAWTLDGVPVEFSAVNVVVVAGDGETEPASVRYDDVVDDTVAVVLPKGRYLVDFLDEDGVPVAVRSASAETLGVRPRCADPVEASDFFFRTPAPSPAPSAPPSVSDVPTRAESCARVAANADCPDDGRRAFAATAGTVDECRARCDAAPTCAYFSFRAATAECRGCDPTSSFSFAADFDVYEPTANAWVRSAGTNLKCPWNGSRLFRSSSSSSSYRDCYRRCYDRPGCAYFTLRRSDGLCLGCGGADASPLTAADGFDAYELVATKTLPYDVAERPNVKCAARDRVVRTAVVAPTRDDCFARCRARRDCRTFSYGERDDRFRGWCLLCGADAALEAHAGFATYRLTRYYLHGTAPTIIASLTARADLAVARLR